MATEVVKLVLKAADFNATALFAVQLKRFLPDRAGVGVFSEGGVRVTKAVERVGDIVRVP